MVGDRFRSGSLFSGLVVGLGRAMMFRDLARRGSAARFQAAFTQIAEQIVAIVSVAILVLGLLISKLAVCKGYRNQASILPSSPISRHAG